MSWEQKGRVGILQITGEQNALNAESLDAFERGLDRFAYFIDLTMAHRALWPLRGVPNLPEYDIPRHGLEGLPEY